jgi:hypothetical protein
MSDVVGAGWYPDAAGGHEFRYWDGRAWTDQVSDNGVAVAAPIAAQAPASAPTSDATRLRTRLIAVMVGAGAGVIGALLPWVSQYDGFTSTTKSGTSTAGGGLCIVLALAIAGLAGMTLSRGFGRGSVITSFVLGCLVVLIAYGNIVDVNAAIDEEAQAGLPEGLGTTPGAGLFVTLIGGLIVVVASVMAFRSARRS